MNIEQLDRGNKILKQIKELKESKQDLVKNYSEHVNNGYDNGISISFSLVQFLMQEFLSAAAHGKTMLVNRLQP